jgi:hypothetical protein
MTQEQAQDTRSLFKIGKIALAFALIAIGFFTACLFNALPSNIEHPSSLFTSMFTSNQPHAPSDFIKEDNILVYKDKIVIDVDNASLSKYASTGSMLPVFDTGANGIRVKVNSPDEIKLGDIISYERNGGLIVHRVIEIGTDSQGLYFVTKGDNNAISDGKVRFSEIKYITIGIIY